ncbi:AP-1 complex subunit mu-2-like, partial [Trifolium medium]|nr:AP-1 complex subunit mu-2-like [Trifolium medium]
MLRAEFRLPSITDEEAAPERKAPIRVKFEIPYFTVSGIQLAFKGGFLKCLDTYEMVSELVVGPSERVTFGSQE